MRYAHGCSSRVATLSGVALIFSNPGRDAHVAYFVAGRGSDASDAVSACFELRDRDIRVADHSLLGNNKKLFLEGYVERVHRSYTEGGSIFMPESGRGCRRRSQHPMHMYLAKAVVF